MLIEGYTNYKVDTKTGLGGTKICFDALMNDAIDFYPEYTGTGLLVLLKPDEKTLSTVSKSAESTYDYVNSEFRKQYGIRWLKPLGFNNSYALMMRRKQSEELKIKTISDLKKYLDSK
jgi:osmoprotectant transport system permease protein